MLSFFFSREHHISGQNILILFCKYIWQWDLAESFCEYINWNLFAVNDQFCHSMLPNISKNGNMLQIKTDEHASLT